MIDAEADRMIDQEVSAAPLIEAVGGDGDVTYFVGAAVSSFTPTCLPVADALVAAILEQLLLALDRSRPGLLPRDRRQREASDLAHQLTRPHPDEDAGRLVVPLEWLLEALDDAAPGTGTQIAVALGRLGGGSNPLHRFLASELDRSRTVITTNFDEYVEACTRGPCRRWVAGSPFDAGAALLKLHGTSSDPGSLRHTLRTVDRRFDEDVRTAVRTRTQGRLVVLGYAGADYDVLDLVAPAGEPVFWVELPGRPAPPGARRLERKVNVVRTDLADLCETWTGEQVAFRGSAAEPWPSFLASLLRPLPAEALEGAARGVIAEAAASYGSARPVLDRYETYLRAAWAGSSELLELLAFKGLLVGAPVPRLRTAAYQVRLARRNEGERSWRLSEAADALEGWLFGQGPLVRKRTFQIHLRAARRHGDGWLWFRAARAARARGRWAEAERLLDTALGTSLPTDREAHCHRMRALVRAARGAPYEADLARARDLFEFSSRTLANADLIRTQAGCELLAGRHGDALASFLASAAEHARHGQRTGLLQSLIGALLTLLVPRFARRYTSRS